MPEIKLRLLFGKKLLTPFPPLYLRDTNGGSGRGGEAVAAPPHAWSLLPLPLVPFGAIQASTRAIGSRIPPAPRDVVGWSGGGSCPETTTGLAPAGVMRAK